MYIVLDQVMPIVLEGKNHYLVLKECSTLEDAESWIKSNKITEYRIFGSGAIGSADDSES